MYPKAETKHNAKSHRYSSHGSRDIFQDGNFSLFGKNLRHIGKCLALRALRDADVLRDSLNSHTHFFRKSAPHGTPQYPAQFPLPSICTASQTLPTQAAFLHRSPSSSDVVPPHFQLFSNFQLRFLVPRTPAKIQGPANDPTSYIQDAPQHSNTHTPPRLPPNQLAPDSIRHIAMPSTNAAPPADRNRTGSAKDAHSAAAAR